MWYLTHIRWWLFLCEEFTDRPDTAEITVGIFSQCGALKHNFFKLLKHIWSWQTYQALCSKKPPCAPRACPAVRAKGLTRQLSALSQACWGIIGQVWDSELLIRELSHHLSPSPNYYYCYCWCFVCSTQTQKCFNNKKKLHQYKIHLYFCNHLTHLYVLLQLTYIYFLNNHYLCIC